MFDDPDVVLELLNTTPVVDAVVTEQLDAAWLRAHGAADVGVGDARALRDALQAATRGAAPDGLATYLDGVTKTPELHADGTLTWQLNAAWLARMVLAWAEIRREFPGRLRPCANGECHLFLLDRSRGGTARWCSMGVCGNRMKARRHYGKSTGRSVDTSRGRSAN